MDTILYWNEVANQANAKTHTSPTSEDPAEEGSRGPCGSSRTYAIVHLAMHDAYFAIDGGYATWLPQLPPKPVNADADVAATGAAHHALVELYTAQKADIDAQLPQGLDQASLDFGAAVAAAVLAARQNDPTTSGAGHVPSNARGRHRQAPDSPMQGFHAPKYGARANCFAATHRYKLDPPPPQGSGDYERAVAEVRGKGIRPSLTGTLPAPYPRRTSEEALIGVFWGYDGPNLLGTPPRLYNQIVREIAVARGNTTGQNARLFALLNAAMGDAGILAWDDKYDYDLWRPVVGIREHDPSLGPTGVAGTPLSGHADPYWLPLGAPASNGLHDPDKPRRDFTPPFPAYPSGHATFGAAAFQSVRKFYDPEIADGPDGLAAGLGFVSDEFNGTTTDQEAVVRPRYTRMFPGGLWQMIEENGRSRVYLGVHWVFDAFAVDAQSGAMDLARNIGGVRLGLDIANDIAANGLKAAAAAGARL